MLEQAIESFENSTEELISHLGYAENILFTKIQQQNEGYCFKIIEGEEARQLPNYEK